MVAAAPAIHSSAVESRSQEQAWLTSGSLSRPVAVWPHSLVAGCTARTRPGREADHGGPFSQSWRRSLIANCSASKCEEPDIAVKTAFMSDLKAAGATEALLAEGCKLKPGRIEAEERDTPNEYVCTAELFESTEKNAAEAQKALGRPQVPQIVSVRHG